MLPSGGSEAAEPVGPTAAASTARQGKGGAGDADNGEDLTGPSTENVWVGAPGQIEAAGLR